METSLVILVSVLALVVILLVLNNVSKGKRKSWYKFQVTLPGGLSLELIVSFVDAMSD